MLNNQIVGLDENIRDTVLRYIETQYRSNQPLFEKARNEMLADDTSSPIFKEPLYEIVKRYPSAQKILPDLIVDLVRDGVEHLDDHTAELIHALVAVRFLPGKPFTHQEKSLEETITNERHLVVTTGTGSGKTYCFLLPLLTKLLIDALGSKKGSQGKWDAGGDP